jgi:hypothetical protein
MLRNQLVHGGATRGGVGWGGWAVSAVFPEKVSPEVGLYSSTVIEICRLRSDSAVGVRMPAGSDQCAALHESQWYYRCRNTDSRRDAGL